MLIPYSGKSLREKIFEVDLLQNSSQLNFKDRLAIDYHCICML